MKPSFVNYQKPLITAMIQEETPTDAILMIEDSLYDGAEAFGIQLESLLPQYRNENDIRSIFSHCMGKPIYITSYRYAASNGYTDEQCAELLLLGAKCGATLCDVMGDLFHKEACELTFDKEALIKQKELIEKLHKLGCEVLISSHVGKHFTEEQVIEYMTEQQKRGADIAKLVSVSDSEEQLLEALGICAHLKNKLSIPYLFLVGGQNFKLVREIGPALGVCMYLCVHHHTPKNTLAQPTIRAIRNIRDSIM